MVLKNMGLPDPHDPDTSLSSNNDVIMFNEDNNEVELVDNMGDRYEGYQQLNGMENIPANDSDSDTDYENENMVTPTTPEAPSSFPAISSAENALLKEVWEETQSKDIEMDSDKVRAVKDAMLNFTLPASSIPEWASNIPEQEWKDHMLEKIQAKTKQSK